MSRRGSFGLILLSILLGGVTYLVGNGSVALWDRDEPRYAQTSRQMLQSGDWVVPHYLDMVRTAKPALIYWCQATAMGWFGDNAFAARFPSAVAILVLLVVFASVLWKYVGHEPAGWATLVFATSGLTIASAKMCITDAVLLLWVTVAQMCLYAAWRGRMTWPVVIVWAVMIGLGGLTKGPVILGMQVMTLVVLWIMRLVDRRWSPSPRADIVETPTPRTGHVLLKILVAVVVVLALTLPWVLLAEHRSPGFISRAFGHEVKDRMLSPLEQHSGPPGYYLASIWITFFPWSLLLPLAIGLALHRRADPRTRFALAAVVGPWLLLEPIRTKLPHYLLPAFPPLAFLTAEAIVGSIRGQIGDLRSLAFRVVVSIWAVLLIVGSAAPWLARRAYAPVGTIIGFQAVVVALTVGTFVAFHRGRIATAVVTMAVGTCAAVLVLFGLYLPHADFLRLSPRVASVLIHHNVTGDDQVKMFEYMEPSLAFYQGGTIREAGSLGFTPKFESQLPPWLVMTRTVWDKAPQSMRSHFQIVDSQSGLDYADHFKGVEVLIVKKK